jgi:hypothetical protein
MVVYRHLEWKLLGITIVHHNLDTVDATFYVVAPSLSTCLAIMRDRARVILDTYNVFECATCFSVHT